MTTREQLAARLFDRRAPARTVATFHLLALAGMAALPLLLLLLACLALIQPVWLTALASPRTIRTTQWILLALGTIYPIRVGWNATP